MADKQSAEPYGQKRTQGKPKKPGWRAVFLEELAKWGVVDHAISVAGVRRSTAYATKHRDREFAAKWEEAEGKIIATMEVVARQRALVGVRKPVYFQGKQIDSIQEVDSGMLRWLLAKKKPDVYGDKLELNQNVNGKLDLNVTGGIDVTLLSDEDLEALDAILDRAHARDEGEHPAVGKNGAGKT